MLTERLQVLGRRAHESDSVVLAVLGEVRPLGEETVPGVNGVHLVGHRHGHDTLGSRDGGGRGREGGDGEKEKGGRRNKKTE